MRPHVGERPPFSPNGHSGAPWLGENGDAPTTTGPSNPCANRTTGSVRPARRCGTSTSSRSRCRSRTPKTQTDPTGMIYMLAQDKADVYAGSKPAQPLAIRANIGDCVAVTLTSEQTDATQASGFAKVNMHIHHVQFDPRRRTA